MFKNTKRPANPQARATIRIIAGGYLIYLAWSMRSDLSQPLVVLFTIAFVVIGAIFVGTAVYGMYQQSRTTAPEEDDSQQETHSPSQSEDAHTIDGD